MIAICDCFCSPEGVKVKFFIIFKVLSVAKIVSDLRVCL